MQVCIEGHQHERYMVLTDLILDGYHLLSAITLTEVDANHRHMFPHGEACDSACGREEEYPDCCDLISLNSGCRIRTKER